MKILITMTTGNSVEHHTMNVSVAMMNGINPSLKDTEYIIKIPLISETAWSKRILMNKEKLNKT